MASAIVVLKRLVQIKLQGQESIVADLFSPVSVISRLAYRIDEIRHAQARACIVWLVGQYAAAPVDETAPSLAPEGIASWAPDVLRKSAISFSKEASIATQPSL